MARLFQLPKSFPQALTQQCEHRGDQHDPEHQPPMKRAEGLHQLPAQTGSPNHADDRGVAQDHIQSVVA